MLTSGMNQLSLQPTRWDVNDPAGLAVSTLGIVKVCISKHGVHGVAQLGALFKQPKQ